MRAAPSESFSEQDALRPVFVPEEHQKARGEGERHGEGEQPRPGGEGEVAGFVVAQPEAEEGAEQQQRHQGDGGGILENGDEVFHTFSTSLRPSRPVGMNISTIARME